MFVRFIKAKDLITKTLAAFIMKMLAAVFGFLLNVVIARQLGVAGTGQFYLCLSCISIAIMVSQVGLGQSLLRFVAVSSSQGNWKEVKGVVRLSRRLCLVTSMLISVLLFCLAPLIANYVFHKDVLSPLIQWMSFAVTPSALFILNGYSLQALGKIKASVFVNGVSMPMFASSLMFILIPLYGVNGSIAAFVLASFVTFLFSYYLWFKFTPQLKTVSGVFKLPVLLQSNIPLFWVSLAQLTMVWSSSIMLGMWGSESDVGIFSVANKTAILVSFILSCVNTVIAPIFAELYHAGELEKLQQVVIKATFLVVLIAAPVAVILAVFPATIMSFFGMEFVSGASVLVILAIGQFVFVVTGAVGFLLTMSGHETAMRNIMIICSFILVLLNWLLIPRFGAFGAAVATSVTLVLQNLIISVVVWKTIGIVGIPLVNVVFSRFEDREAR